MNTTEHPIIDNFNTVKEAITACAIEAGRDPESVKLIAISKKHPASAVNTILSTGHMDFGENQVQEAVNKIPQVNNPDVTWHFIGHLQSNKAKFIPGNFIWIHSLDSLKLAKNLNALAEEKGATINALVEVNIAHDPNKHGLAPEDVVSYVGELVAENLSCVKLRGLMGMGPHGAKSEILHTLFSNLRKLRDECIDKYGLTEFTELSMGMSGDYCEAIKEGATMIRVGTGIFGQRDYSKK